MSAHPTLWTSVQKVMIANFCCAHETRVIYTKFCRNAYVNFSEARLYRIHAFIILYSQHKRVLLPPVFYKVLQTYMWYRINGAGWLLGGDVLTWKLLLSFSAAFFYESLYILVAFFLILGSFNNFKKQNEKCFPNEIMHCACRKPRSPQCRMRVMIACSLRRKFVVRLSCPCA
jgi:hypothetical protein